MHVTSSFVLVELTNPHLSNERWLLIYLYYSSLIIVKKTPDLARIIANKLTIEHNRRS